MLYSTGMKAVILAAGRSFRMKPIEDKNFISFCGVMLVEHQIQMLKKAGVNNILLVGGAHNVERLESVAKKMKCEVVEQEELDAGMAGAVLSAKKWIDGEPFLLVSSNDVLEIDAYKKVLALAKKKTSVLLAKKVTSYFPGGYLSLDKTGTITGIVEKPGAGNEPSDMVNMVVHYHADSKALLSALEMVSTDKDDRYERALQKMFDKGRIYKAIAYSGYWQPVKFPWHIIDLMMHFMPCTGTAVRKGKNVSVAKSAVIRGPVVVEDGVKVFDNAVIQGPAYIGKNSIIANGALVRGSHVGANCVIGFGSEIARSYIADHVWTHTNYVGDSIIGNNVSFGSGSITGNLRLDEREIVSMVKGEKVGAGRNKLGLITGDNIRVGVNTSFMPGIKVGSNCFIGGGITIAKDIEDGMFVTGEHTLKVRPNREKIPTRKPL